MVCLLIFGMFSCHFRIHVFRFMFWFLADTCVGSGNRNQPSPFLMLAGLLCPCLQSPWHVISVLSHCYLHVITVYSIYSIDVFSSHDLGWWAITFPSSGTGLCQLLGLVQALIMPYWWHNCSSLSCWLRVFTPVGVYLCSRGLEMDAVVSVSDWCLLLLVKEVGDVFLSSCHWLWMQAPRSSSVRQTTRLSFGTVSLDCCLPGGWSSLVPCSWYLSLSGLACGFPGDLAVLYSKSPGQFYHISTSDLHFCWGSFSSVGVKCVHTPH